MSRGYERIQEDLEIKDWIEESAKKDPLSLFYIQALYVLRSRKLADEVFRIWKGKGRTEYLMPMIKSLAKKGYTMYQIARILDIPVSSLEHYQNDIYFSRIRKYWTDEEIEILRQCIYDDLSIWESVRKLYEEGFERSYESVRQKMKKIRKEMENSNVLD